MKDQQQIEVVKGEYIGSTLGMGFTYRYRCVECKRQFRESAPELTVPILCCFCYTGKRPSWINHKTGVSFKTEKKRKQK